MTATSLKPFGLSLSKPCLSPGPQERTALRQAQGERWWIAFLVVLFLLVPGPAAAAPTFPPLSGRVVDQANLLSPQQEAELTQKLETLQRASSRQLVVATVTSLQDVPIEDYGYQLGRAWRIGQQGANNGVILLVAPNEKRVRIEVGYGLEPIMTDALSNQIIQQQILPRFRANDFAGGIIAGSDAIIAQLQAPLEAAEQNAAAAERAQADSGRGRNGRHSNSSPLPLIFWLGVTIFIIYGLTRSGLRGRSYRRRRRGWGGPIVIWGPGWGGGHRDDWGSGGGWGGGGSSWGGGDGGGSSWGGGGGGGFSGGGGSFGGGGASGGW